jgi:hypothetical protein
MILSSKIGIMTKKEKREDKIRGNTTNVSLEDFEALIKQYGYIEEGSKHPKAVIGKDVFSYRRTNPVHRPYVDYILDLIENIKRKDK